MDVGVGALELLQVPLSPGEAERGRDEPRGAAGTKGSSGSGDMARAPALTLEQDMALGSPLAACPAVGSPQMPASLLGSPSLKAADLRLQSSAPPTGQSTEGPL